MWASRNVWQWRLTDVGLTPGETFRVMRYGDRLELIAVKKAKDLRGFARGMDTTIDRDRDRL